MKMEHVEPIGSISAIPLCDYCGARGTLCTEHKRRNKQLYYEHLRTVGSIKCALCGTSPMPTPVWREL